MSNVTDVEVFAFSDCVLFVCLFVCFFRKVLSTDITYDIRQKPKWGKLYTMYVRDYFWDDGIWRVGFNASQHNEWGFFDGLMYVSTS